MSSPQPSVAGVCVAVAGSVLPDLDMLRGRPGTIAYLAYHRTWTHALAATPLAALAIAGIGEACGAEESMLTLAALALAGLIGHLALDALNAFGTAIWLPFSARKTRLDLVFELDPAMTGLLAAGALAQGAVETGKSSMIGATIAAGMVAYVTWRFVSRRSFSCQAGELCAERGLSFETMTVVPAPLWRWRAVLAGEREHLIIRRGAGGLRVDVRPRDNVPEDLRTEAVRTYERYARHLDVTVEEGGVSLRNLVYPPDTYRLEVRAREGAEPSHSISLPNWFRAEP